MIARVTITETVVGVSVSPAEATVLIAFAGYISRVTAAVPIA